MGGVFNSFWGVLKNAIIETGKYLVFVCLDSPWIGGYPFSAAGFGTRYTLTQPANIFRLSNGVSFNDTGTYVAICNNDNPTFSIYIYCYAFSTAGFGTRYNNPAGHPGAATQSVAWNRAGTYIFEALALTPYIGAYPFSAGFGSRVANPATLTTGQGTRITINNTDTAVIMGVGTTQRVAAWVWSDATGFGTKYAQPVSPIATGNGSACAFNPTSNEVIFSGATAPYYNQYPWSDATGFGTVYAQAFTTPVNPQTVGDFNPTGTVLQGYLGVAPWGGAYVWNAGSGLGTKYADPVGLTPVSVGGSAFDAGGNNIVYNGSAGGTLQYLSAIPFSSASGFGTLYAAPVGTSTTARGYGIDFF
jgi:hypothetical protein